MIRYLRLSLYTLLMPVVWVVSHTIPLVGPARLYLLALTSEWEEWMHDASELQLNLIFFVLLMLWVALPVSLMVSP